MENLEQGNSIEKRYAERTPLRVLVVHNAYQQRGGEDAVVADEMSLLRNHGNNVELFSRHNDEVEGANRLLLAAETIWSTRSARKLDDNLTIRRPDVIHVHNTWPLISPSIYWKATQLGIPIVQTLHNFRLNCPQAMFLRNNQICEDCLGHLPWRGVLRSCYRHSTAQSAVLATMLVTHRALGTWQDKVTRYIALNHFCRNKFIEGGLPAGKIVVKPNFVDFAPPKETPRNGFLFVGRLSPEKGVRVAVDAVRSIPGCELRVAGSGPEQSILSDHSGITALGMLDAEAIRQEMQSAVALVLPSLWYENFPRTLVEALACGLPIIASRLGAMAELVDDGVTGLLFEPGNPAALAEKIIWAMAHTAEMAQMGRQARICYEQSYTAEQNYTQLMAIYQEAIAESLGKARG